MAKVDLRLDWATYKAARCACERWHYSGTMQSGRLVKIGVWENSRFIGVILFGHGAGRATRGDKYGLADTHEVVELTRVALRDHVSPVTRMIAVALRMLKQYSPGIRMVISFADELGQGHLGKIYQAGNWIYTGAHEARGSFVVYGKIIHGRSMNHKGRSGLQWVRDHVDPDATVAPARKHRYLMPLDAEMRARIAPLSQPYPKRDKQAMAGPPAQRRGSTDRHAPDNEAA